MLPLALRASVPLMSRIVRAVRVCAKIGGIAMTGDADADEGVDPYPVSREGVGRAVTVTGELAAEELCAFALMRSIAAGLDVLLLALNRLSVAVESNEGDRLARALGADAAVGRAKAMTGEGRSGMVGTVGCSGGVPRSPTARPAPSFFFHSIPLPAGTVRVVGSARFGAVVCPSPASNNPLPIPRTTPSASPFGPLILTTASFGTISGAPAPACAPGGTTGVGAEGKMAMGTSWSVSGMSGWSRMVSSPKSQGRAVRAAGMNLALVQGLRVQEKPTT